MVKKQFDWHYDWITDEHCPLKPCEGEMDIEIINLGGSYSTEEALRQMFLLGYKPAPSNYLLDFSFKHPEVLKEKRWIVSLDEANLFVSGGGGKCFLGLYWDGERDLDLAGRAGEWDDNWWFAVVRKEHSDPLPLSDDTLSLGNFISLIKEIIPILTINISGKQEELVIKSEIIELLK